MEGAKLRAVPATTTRIVAVACGQGCQHALRDCFRFCHVEVVVPATVTNTSGTKRAAKHLRSATSSIQMLQLQLGKSPYTCVTQCGKVTTCSMWESDYKTSNRLHLGDARHRLHAQNDEVSQVGMRLLKQ